MTELTPISGLIGGLGIGLAAVTLLWGIGRIAGISGIIYGLFTTGTGDAAWRATFIVSLLAGAALTAVSGLLDVHSIVFQTGIAGSAIAGFLVGLGVTLGSGCTSGHGVCGLARLSPRSFVATAIFMAVAIVVVFVNRHVGIGVL